jgi:hypothetical protein
MTQNAKNHAFQPFVLGLPAETQCHRRDNSAFRIPHSALRIPHS